MPERSSVMMSAPRCLPHVAGSVQAIPLNRQTSWGGVSENFLPIFAERLEVGDPIDLLAIVCRLRLNSGLGHKAAYENLGLLYRMTRHTLL